MTSDETAGPGNGKTGPLLLDFTKPVAVTMLTILHVIPDADDPGAIVAKVMGAVPSGSYLAVSHSASDLFDQVTRDSFRSVVDRMVQQQYTPRSREQVSSSRPARGQSHQSHQSAETV